MTATGAVFCVSHPVQPALSSCDGIENSGCDGGHTSNAAKVPIASTSTGPNSFQKHPRGRSQD